jgi:DNA (cytosine-5)-methyltransferase 1
MSSRLTAPTNGKRFVAATAVDLFCGAGGLTRGLLNAEIPVAAGYDIDESCRYAYEHNNSSAKFFTQSVADLDGVSLAKHYPKGHIRILVGCAPCQTFSRYTQGLKNANDPKWTLLGQFARLIREVKPDILSMENVPDLRKHSIYREFLATLSREGFHFTPDDDKRIVYCPDYGLPQHRRRLVLVASKLGPIDLIPPTHAPDAYVRVEDVLSKLPSLAAGQMCDTDHLHRSSHLSPLNLRRIKRSKPGGSWRDWPTNLVAACHREKTGKSYPSVYGRMEWKKPSPTITTQFFGFGNGRFGHPEQDRGLSLREGAILQSFPTNYEFVKPGQEYCFKAIGRMIGNAVPVRLGEVVGQTIREHLKEHGV